MQQTKNVMGMHVTADVRDGNELKGCNLIFDYFKYIDKTFSTYITDSDISKINRGELKKSEYNDDVKEILKLAEQTKQETQGYFNIQKSDGLLDPSGIVKGWAIWQAGLMLKRKGYHHFFIDAGGDIQGSVADASQSWRVGIRNPFNKAEIVKVLKVTNQGVATSGSYERGNHIYNPHNPEQQITDIVSLTVIGPNIYEADRFATAAFAMGKPGIAFIESQKYLEGYIIDNKGIAIETSNFKQYVTT